MPVAVLVRPRAHRGASSTVRVVSWGEGIRIICAPIISCRESAHCLGNSPGIMSRAQGPI